MKPPHGPYWRLGVTYGPMNKGHSIASIGASSHVATAPREMLSQKGLCGLNPGACDTDG